MHLLTLVQQAKVIIIKNMEYIELPIDFSKSLKKQHIKRCSKEESIAQFLMVLITSHYGEVVVRDDFGSVIWDLEFNQLVKIGDWEEKVKESLIASITKYEKRLKNIDVHVQLSEIDDSIDSKDTHIRRKAQINVNGIMVDNNIPFNFGILVYISPLSQ